MRPFDLVIAGGSVVSADSVIEADIGVTGETIVAIGADLASQGAQEVISAAGRHVLPGAIDSHVHFREPGYTHKEDWGSGTAAAAVGGVTTVFEMPNTDPPTGTVDALHIKQEAAARQAHVDYGIYGLLDEHNIDQLEALIAHGVAGFKCFMGNTFGNLPAPSDGAMLEGFEILAAAWRALRRPCRKPVDHGAPPSAHGGRRTNRPARSSRRAPGGVRDRGDRPRHRLRRMDRRAAPHRAS